MEKYKHQYWVIIIIVFIAFGGGYILSRSNSTKELQKVTEQHKQALQDSIKTATKHIDELNKQIHKLDSALIKSSVIINSLENQRQKDEALTQQRREQAKHLTKDEKKDFIINRYTTNSN